MFRPQLRPHIHHGKSRTMTPERLDVPDPVTMGDLLGALMPPLHHTPLEVSPILFSYRIKIPWIPKHIWFRFDKFFTCLERSGCIMFATCRKL